MTNLGKYKIPEWYGIWIVNKLRYTTKPSGGEGVVGSFGVGWGGGGLKIKFDTNYCLLLLNKNN